MKIHQSFLVLSAVSLLSGAVGFTLSGQIASAQSAQTNQNAQPPGMGGQQGGPGGACRGGHRPPDLDAAAKQLGITKAKLVQALGLPDKPPTDDQGRPSGPPPRPDLKAAAQRLGITEEQLVKALGIPARPPGQAPNGQGPNDQPGGGSNYPQ